MRFLVPLPVLLLACSCGGSSPTAPTGPERVSGVWVGHSTLTSASGGECVGSTLQAAVGSRDQFAAPIQQSAADLTATVAYQGNRTVCELAGNVQSTSVLLTVGSCRAGQVIPMRCSNGDVRDLRMLTGRISASAVSGAGSGTDITTWNVSMPGTDVSVGVVQVTAGFTWKVLQLPPSDFHIFDGSILPGYVDGVVTIPAEDEPFCVECGWFLRP
jgi:hypothetical protein